MLSIYRKEDANQERIYEAFKLQKTRGSQQGKKKKRTLEHILHFSFICAIQSNSNFLF
jgi:hypothetical protein